MIWLGASKQQSVWLWDYNSVDAMTGYHTWASGQPAVNDDDACMIMESSQRIWHDVDCTAEYPFICEFNDLTLVLS